MTQYVIKYFNIKYTSQVFLKQVHSSEDMLDEVKLELNNLELL